MKMTSHPHRFTQLAQAAAIVVGLWSMGAMAQTTKPEDAAPAPKEDSVRLGTITITGTGDRLGAGMMLNEDASKARSTVTRSATEKSRGTENAYQALSILPGVNTFNHDATGLFGGGLTIRGFNSDQIGFTVNGVPVNDSGNFAVFPQEYADQENLCTQTLTQGSPDVESPHVGATGGNVGLTSCDPEDKRRVRFSQTLGGLSLSRSFVRYDTGKFADGRAKVFLSYSHTQADKWKGEGGAKRDHIDAAFSFDINPDNRILGSILYNRAINNNINSISLNDLNTRGYDFDFSTAFTPGHLTPVNGTAQVEAGPSPAYYKLAYNPFENVVASLSGSFKLSNDVLLKVQPYLWYGFGNGGVQQRTQRESNSFLNTATGALTGSVDLNGDGDTLDTIIMARSSVTRTMRPGVTTEFNIFKGNHAIRAGLWFERANHRQTQPYVKVNDDGSSTDVWHQDGVILRPDGTAYQGRDTRTISTAYQVYVSDAITVLDNKGVLTLGLRAPTVKRNLTNNANEGGTVGYQFEKSFHDVLPQLGMRYDLAKGQQVFANVAKNFRAPPNFAFFPGNTSNVTVVNGVATLRADIKAETSIVADFGYRYQGRALSFSASAYDVAFRDRQANAFDPVSNTSTFTNIGKVSNRGVELELGTAITSGFSAYVSLTAQKSKIKNDYIQSATRVYPTSGKELPLTPKTMAGLSLQYSQGPWYARVKAKHTGAQWADMMNNERVPAYTTADLDAGYNLGALGPVSNAQVRFNVSNLANARYRSSSSGQAQLSTVAVGTLPANGSVFYYLGAPRLATLTLSGDF